MAAANTPAPTTLRIRMARGDSLLSSVVVMRHSSRTLGSEAALRLVVGFYLGIHYGMTGALVAGGGCTGRGPTEGTPGAAGAVPGGGCTGCTVGVGVSLMFDPTNLPLSQKAHKFHFSPFGDVCGMQHWELVSPSALTKLM